MGVRKRSSSARCSCPIRWIIWDTNDYSDRHESGKEVGREDDRGFFCDGLCGDGVSLLKCKMQNAKCNLYLVPTLLRSISFPRSCVGTRWDSYLAPNPKAFFEIRVRRDREVFMPQQELESSIREVWSLFKETEKRFKETDERMDRRSRETDEKIKQVSEQVGALTGKWGKFVEGLIVPGAVSMFREKGIEIDRIFQRVEAHKDKDNLEIDILGVNSEYALLIEAKSTLGVEDVKEHVERIQAFKRFFPEYEDRKVIGAVAGIVIDEGADRFAYRQGFFVIGQTGETVKILNDEKFEPKTW